MSRGRKAGFETVALDESFSGWLKRRRPAILHVHAGIGWEGHELVESGFNAGVPVVRTEHLPYLLTDPDQKSRHRLVANMADSLITVSDAAAESYRAEGFAQVHTVCNGVQSPVARGTRDQIRAALAVAPGCTVVVTVARFTVQKGHECLLRAIAEASHRLPDAIFLLVGEGPEREAMQALATVLKLENVDFLGERSDVPDLLTAADLFALPSLFEGLPLVVLEAMALGLPVVATRIGGTVEALGSDHPYLVPASNSSLLAAVIVEAISDHSRRRAVGMQGMRRFEERFTAARMGREMAAVYCATTERYCVA